MILRQAAGGDPRPDWPMGPPAHPHRPSAASM